MEPRTSKMLHNALNYNNDTVDYLYNPVTYRKISKRSQLGLKTISEYRLKNRINVCSEALEINKQSLNDSGMNPNPFFSTLRSFKELFKTTHKIVRLAESDQRVITEVSEIYTPIQDDFAPSPRIKNLVTHFKAQFEVNKSLVKRHN